VLLRRPALLRVHDAVRGEVEHRLARHAGQVVGRLHDGDGVVEGLQVPAERTGVGRIAEPVGERLGVGSGQGVPGGVRQLEDGLRSQPSVEVVVQDNLGQGA
jgi:hypothetical protein